jgi:hypothetical protein
MQSVWHKGVKVCLTLPGWQWCWCGSLPRGPRTLCGIKLPVGGINQCCSVHIGRITMGDADARADPDPRLPDHKGRDECGQEPVGKLPRLYPIVSDLNDGKFVAAKPAQQAAVTNCLAHPLRNGTKQRIAHGMAMPIVHWLESIKVKQHQVWALTTLQRCI